MVHHERSLLWDEADILSHLPISFHWGFQSSAFEISSISKSPQSSNIVSFVDWMQACILRLAGFIFSACFEVVSGCKAQTGCRLDWDSNCHFESDKVLICPPGTERLDITVDKWAVEQNWQDAREDKMPSASVFFLLLLLLYVLSQLDNS